MIRRGDEDGIDVLLLEQVPEVLVEFRLAPDHRRRHVEPTRVHVAQGGGQGRAHVAVPGAAKVLPRHDILIEMRERAQEPPPASAEADVTEVQAVAGSRLGEHRRRHDRHAERRGRRPRDEGSSSDVIDLFHVCLW